MRRNDTAGEEDPETSVDNQDQLPPLSAAFLVLFDLKVGYSIAWKRTYPHIDLDGAVEYKSLPSGLHNVKQDLIYFTHGDYAGISAFVSGAAGESERHARLVAVGILVPLSSGRLGQSWLHTRHIQDLAKYCAKTPADTRPLEEFWEKFRTDGRPTAGINARRESLDPTSLSNDSLSKRRSRAYSTANGLLAPSQSLHSSHPVRSMLRFLDIFGPLTFPLYRAALLRKRILIIAEPPVRESCNFVYDLSILSTIPSSTADLLLSSSANNDDLPRRFRALFSVGVHDIPQLAATATAQHHQRGWVACSTDEVLAMKTQLYDIIVELPSDYASASNQGSQKRWPTIKTVDQAPVKATQRDLCRYRILRQELHALRHPTISTPKRSPDAYRDDSGDDTPPSPTPNPDSEIPETQPLIQTSSGDSGQTENTSTQYEDPQDEEEKWHELAEPKTWSALAYSSFLWWASAGEQDSSSDSSEQETSDRSLFHSALSSTLPLSSPSQTSVRSPQGKTDHRRSGDFDSKSLGGRSGSGGAEMAVVGYFLNLTRSMVQGLSHCVARQDGDDEESSDDGGEGVSQRDWAAHRNSNLGEGSEDTEGEREDAVPVDREELDAVYVTADDLTKLGLDRWSATDKAFVEDAMQLWFGREADVRLSSIECCGVRLL